MGTEHVDQAMLCRFLGGETIVGLAVDYELSLTDVVNGLWRALDVKDSGGLTEVQHG